MICNCKKQTFGHIRRREALGNIEMVGTIISRNSWCRPREIMMDGWRWWYRGILLIEFIIQQELRWVEQGLRCVESQECWHYLPRCVILMAAVNDESALNMWFHQYYADHFHFREHCQAPTAAGLVLNPGQVTETILSPWTCELMATRLTGKSIHNLPVGHN